MQMQKPDFLSLRHSSTATIQDLPITTSEVVLNEWRDITLSNQVVTFDDLVSGEKVYKALFIHLCRIHPEKEEDYKTLLKIYNEDYRLTTITIENENMKQTLNKLKETFDE